MDDKRSNAAEKKQRSGKTAKKKGKDDETGGRRIRTIRPGLFSVDGRGAHFMPVHGSVGTTVVTVVGGAIVGSLLKRAAKSSANKDADQPAPEKSSADR
jgi:hypothetical protein